ncbi:hypothetical protein QYE76_025482 [Lolium multiflorum]|uniref:Glutathione S-transferase T3-like n=1 Tax=Lolium multiflorum TaxID=4521 RepID=A0AAD8REI0_LOLMU|nr:hypothetical protein QYE76_025482 [Lolium multiflorum]
MTGARTLFGELLVECVPPSMQAVATIQAPPSYPPTMRTTMQYPLTEQAPPPPPINIEEDNIGHAGTMNINEEPLFVDELTQATTAQGRCLRTSKRTSNYTELEDRMVVEGWLAIRQNPLTGVEQKGTTFWRRIHEYFHEHHRYGDERFYSERNECSLQKRWGTIQTECNKFQAAYHHVRRVPVSGIKMKDLA